MRGARSSRSIRPTCARSPRSKTCSRVRTAGKRRSRCSRSARSCSTTKPQRRETLLQAAAIWEERLADLSHAAELYERVRSADSATSSQATARGDLRAAGQVGRARRDPARAVGVGQRRRAADPDPLTRSRRSTSASSAIRRARSTCSRRRSTATAPDDRHRARAPRHRDRTLAGGARGIQQARRRARARGSPRGRRPVGRRSAAGTASTCRSSTTRAIRCSRRCASIQRTPARSRRTPTCSASAAAGRAERDLAAPGCRRAIARQEDGAVHPARRVDRADAGRRRRDPRLRASARARSDVARGARSARPPVPSHRGMGAARRRSCRAAPSSRPTRPRSFGSRLEIGSICDAAPRRSSASAIAAYQQVLDIDAGEHRRAARARDAVREDRAERKVSRGARGPARRRALGQPSASRSTSASPRHGKSGSASSIARRKRTSKSSRSIRATPPRTTCSRACTSKPGATKSWSRRTATTSAVTTDVATRIELYLAIGQVYETELHDVDRRDPGVQGRAVARPDDAPRSTRSPGCTRRSASGTARSTRWLGSSSCATTRASRTCTGASAASSTASSATPTRPKASCCARSRLDAGHMPTMEALTEHYADRGDWLKAAQMMSAPRATPRSRSTRCGCCSRPRTSTCTSCTPPTRPSSCTRR